MSCSGPIRVTRPYISTCGPALVGADGIGCRALAVDGDDGPIWFWIG
jgi:hypothetical protein